MRVALAALDFRPGEMGGIEIYLKDLLKGLAADSANTYGLFCSANAIDEIAPSQHIEKIVVQRKIVHKIAHRLRLPMGRIAYALDTWRPDVVHYPLQVMFPAQVSAKKIVSSMDLQHEYYPEFFSKEELQARAQAFRPSLENADAVIAISHFTKQSLVEKYAIEPDKIHVVHLAYDNDLYSSKPVQASLELPDKFLYYPAATWPHKNHERLIRAFASVKPTNKNAYLVFSGIKKSQQQKLGELVKSLKLSSSVIFLGYLNSWQLPEIYHRATGLIFPSLFEGFGLPIVEAMACGCPVAASDTSSIPEVAGSAAILFNPTNVSDIANAMISILSSNELRSRLRAKGFQNVRRFSLKKMAKQTIDVYHEVANAA